MSDGVDESLVVKVARVILGGGVEEDIELFLGESIGLGGEDLAKVGGGDGAGVFGIENLENADNSILLSFFDYLEGVADNFLGVSSVELVGKHVQEDGEVDWSRSLGKHGVHGGVEAGSAKGLVGGQKIVLVDETVSVGIDHAEGLLELLDLGGLEHREDVRRLLLRLLSLLWWHVGFSKILFQY